MQKKSSTRNSWQVNSNFTRIIMRYAITLGVGAGFVFLTLWLNDYSLLTENVDKYRLLTDAFSIPGIIFIMVGCLVFISTDGFFDMITFGLSRAKSMLIPLSKKSDETYYDYKQRKAKNRLSGYSFLFFCGLIYLVVLDVVELLFVPQPTVINKTIKVVNILFFFIIFFSLNYTRIN